MKVNRSRRLAVLALALGSLVAALVPVAGAVAQESPPQGLSIEVMSARLLAKGAGVEVTVEYQCPFGTASLSLRVSQRAGSAVTQGFGGEEVSCTGAPETTTVIVVPDGGRPFKVGAAIVEAELFSCSFFCGSVQDDEEVRVSRR
jgi:hypothetical protein